MSTTACTAPGRLRSLADGVRFPAFAIAASLLICVTTGVGAQQRDSTRAGVQTPVVPTSRVDTVPVSTLPSPPLSPKRAFLLSLAFPGYAQARLDHPSSSALFFAVEAASVVMLRKSLSDLRIAKRFGRDSVAARFAVDPETGMVVVDPGTGAPVVAEWLPPAYSEEIIGARRTHLEDWIAVLIFNHLIAGAEAFVSAHLWDVPAAVSLTAVPDAHGIRVGAAVRW